MERDRGVLEGDCPFQGTPWWESNYLDLSQAGKYEVGPADTVGLRRCVAGHHLMRAPYKKSLKGIPNSARKPGKRYIMANQCFPLASDTEDPPRVLPQLLTHDCSQLPNKRCNHGIHCLQTFLIGGVLTESSQSSDTNRVQPMV